MIRRSNWLLVLRGLVDVDIYTMLILRDQPGVRSLEFISLVAISGHNYLACLGKGA